MHSEDAVKIYRELLRETEPEREFREPFLLPQIGEKAYSVEQLDPEWQHTYGSNARQQLLIKVIKYHGYREDISRFVGKNASVKTIRTIIADDDCDFKKSFVEEVQKRWLSERWLSFKIEEIAYLATAVKIEFEEIAQELVENDQILEWLRYYIQNHHGVPVFIGPTLPKTGSILRSYYETYLGEKGPNQSMSQAATYAFDCSGPHTQETLDATIRNAVFTDNRELITSALRAGAEVPYDIRNLLVKQSLSRATLQYGFGELFRIISWFKGDEVTGSLSEEERPYLTPETVKQLRQEGVLGTSDISKLVEAAAGLRPVGPMLNGRDSNTVLHYLLGSPYVTTQELLENLPERITSQEINLFVKTRKVDPEIFQKRLVFSELVKLEPSLANSALVTKVLFEKTTKTRDSSSYRSYHPHTRFLEQSLEGLAIFSDIIGESNAHMVALRAAADKELRPHVVEYLQKSCKNVPSEAQMVTLLSLVGTWQGSLNELIEFSYQ